MGVFDFLHKPRPRQRHSRYGGGSRHGRPGATPSSRHHQVRTITRVERHSSLPDEIESPGTGGRHYRPHPNRVTTTSGVATNDDLKKSSHKKNDMVEQVRKKNPDDDDFTRLTRMEVKIENYITRYREIHEELQCIGSNLARIYQEFQHEFQTEIIPKQNKHIIDIGDRIMTKLEPFKDEPDVAGKTDVAKPADGGKSERPIEASNPEKVNRETKKKETDANQKTNRYSTIYEEKNNGGYSDGETGLKTTSGVTNSVQVSRPTITTANIVTGTNLRRAEPIILNGDMTPYTMVHARPAIVSSTPYGSINEIPVVATESVSTTNSALHYQSTPALAQPYSMVGPKSMEDTSFARAYSPVPSPATSEQRRPSLTTHANTGTRQYISVTSRMHSEHPEIEYCFRKLEHLRPRVMFQKMQHKLSTYKGLNDEIQQLYEKLSTVQCPKGSLTYHDKNVALCELHNLAGALERNVECTNPDCVMCNSFKFKPEISV